MQDDQPLHVDGTIYHTRLTRKYLKPLSGKVRNPLEVCAQIPGVVWEVHAIEGAQVRQGDPLITLEAMKMLNPIAAPRTGRISRIHVKPGDRVSKHQILVDFH